MLTSESINHTIFEDIQNRIQQGIQWALSYYYLAKLRNCFER